MLAYNGVAPPRLCSNYLRNYYSALLTYWSNYYFLPRYRLFTYIVMSTHGVRRVRRTQLVSSTSGVTGSQPVLCVLVYLLELVLLVYILLYIHVTHLLR